MCCAHRKPGFIFFADFGSHLDKTNLISEVDTKPFPSWGRIDKTWHGENSSRPCQRPWRLAWGPPESLSQLPSSPSAPQTPRNGQKLRISTSEKSLPDRPMLRVGQILQHKFAKKIVGRQVCHWQHYWGKGNKNFAVHCALYKCIGCCIMYIIIIMVQCWLFCASQGEDHSKVKFNLIHCKYKHSS